MLATLKFIGGLVGGGKGNDVRRGQRVILSGEQMGDALGQHLGLAGTGGGNDL